MEIIAKHYFLGLLIVNKMNCKSMKRLRASNRLNCFRTIYFTILVSYIFAFVIDWKMSSEYRKKKNEESENIKLFTA